MTDVFVSHSGKDDHVVLPIIEALRQTGLSVSHLHIPFSIKRIRALKKLKRAQCVVVLWSKATAESTWVQEGIHQAILAWSSERLVLAALDNTPLPVGLRDLSAISIESESDSGTKELVERVQFIVAEAKARRGFGLGDAAAYIGAFIFVFIAGFAVTEVIAPNMMRFLSISWDIAHRGGEPSPIIVIVLMALISGAAVGAGALWAVWSVIARLRQRSKRVSSVALLQQVETVVTSAERVFVSYSSQDRLVVEELVQQIEQLGHAVWIDRQSRTSQGRYAGSVVGAIRTSKIVALMGSHNAFASDHVIREVYVAGDCKKPFLVFQLDSTEFPDEILYFVSGFPRLPVTALDRQKLRAEIARLI